MKQHDEIYLQVGEPDDEFGVLWCEDKIFDSDIKYVRADIVAALQAENKEILARYDSLDECYKEFIDEINKATGAPEWEYPGQVIRDVKALQAENERLLKENVRMRETIIISHNATVVLEKECQDG